MVTQVRPLRPNSLNAHGYEISNENPPPFPLAYPLQNGERRNFFGRLDVVFANAGINGVQAPIGDLTPEEWDRTINVNLRGTFLTIRYTVPHLKKAGGGAIIVTSSINGTRYFANSGATAYAVSKAGQLAMVQMLAVELGPSNIRINAICPGASPFEKRH